MAITFLSNISARRVSIETAASSNPLLELYNTSNGNGSIIRFSDQTTQTQSGDLTYYQ